MHPCYNIEDIYKFYKKAIANKSIKYKVTLAQYKDICYSYNQTITDLILNHSQCVKLPYRLGEIGIKKRKMNYKEKYLKFDYGEYNKTGNKTFHLNAHSNEWKARWYWSKKRCVVINKSLYSFTPTMTNKRKLSAIMLQKGGHKKFYEA